MSQKIQFYVLGGLILILAASILSNWGGGTDLALLGGSPEKFTVMNVDNPTLRLDLLEKIRKQEYSGLHINIFTGKAVPPPIPVNPSKVDPALEKPPEPPPLNVPFKFFGYSTDPKGGKKKAFFTNGEDVFILGEGETIQNKFRLLRIGNTTADVEEIQSGRRATLNLELPQPGS